MLIPRWVKVAAILASLAALVGAYFAWENAIYQRGYDKADGEAKAREERIRADALEQFNKAAATAREREQKLLDDLNAASTQRYEENAKHEKIISDLRARARNGDLRLLVDVDPRSLPGCAPAPGTGFTARLGNQARADLMPGITDNLLRLAGDSARDVRRYNDLVDAYNRARANCNAEPIVEPAP